MTKIVAIANQKGGVAKTTTTIAKASLIGTQKTCLVVDLDSQANLTDGLGVREINDEQLTASNLFNPRQDPNSIVVSTRWGIDLIPSDIGLAQKEAELIAEPDSHFILKDQLGKLSQYDYVLLDCPPSLGRLTYSALTAAELILIPVQCQYFSAKGYKQLLNTIQAVQMRSNPSLEILGVLPTMSDTTNISKGALISLSKVEGVTVFAPVPKSVKFTESQLAGIPIDRYIRENHSIKESEELIERLILPYQAVVERLLALEMIIYA
ncbi:ParA family protein [Chroococcidiopsis sp. CCNUC1]|uniref:ParA family protein n=1 Tax=Chroococcidiopsis sp. CCNUC1 TaxID=2653189 RepID=UPI00201FB667|nr:AAA family ATPase [Chroococcidiopsis sp. CCNUC1]URD53893.1 AAA family ATPase [Chroococcidiopsis sp. CCNUC1]